MKMNRVNSIEVTYFLSEEQYEKIQELTQKIKDNLNPAWTEQMSLQHAVGTLGFPHLTDVYLQLLEISVEISLLSRK